jgi:hypothetical protein
MCSHNGLIDRLTREVTPQRDVHRFASQPGLSIRSRSAVFLPNSRRPGPPECQIFGRDTASPAAETPLCAVPVWSGPYREDRLEEPEDWRELAPRPRSVDEAGTPS